MTFKRVTNPEVAYILWPWYVPVTHTREDICMELFARMNDDEDDTFVIIAMEERRILGMAVAYTRKNDVFLWQARSEGLVRGLVDQALALICTWAKDKGFNRIATMPNRAAKIWKRRWGFESSVDGEIIKEL